MFLRLAILGLLIAGSLAYPALWIITIVVGGEMLSKTSEKEPQQDFQTLLKRHIASSDPQWQDRLRNRCESPAEVAFLDAMVDTFGLRPQGGVLRGKCIRFDLQVVMPPYRVDFLVMDWLVVEIDGSAYHSSAEAVGRDRQRDEFMQRQGYRVLRIPAKAVFQAPAKAIDRVRAALAEGRPSIEQRPEGRKEQGSKARLVKAATFLEELNAGTQRIRAVQQAMAGPEMVFHLEKTAIDSAIKSAQSKLQIEEYIGENKTRRSSYERFNEELRAYTMKHDGEDLSTPYFSEKQALVVPPFVNPPKHEADAINTSINHAFNLLCNGRANYLAEERSRLQREPRLRALAKANLADLGCPEVWALIASPD